MSVQHYASYRPHDSERGEDDGGQRDDPDGSRRRLSTGIGRIGRSSGTCRWIQKFQVRAAQLRIMESTNPEGTDEHAEREESAQGRAEQLEPVREGEANASLPFG